MAMTDEINLELISEILPFLRSARPDLRTNAANLCLQVAGSEKGRALLHEAGAVRWLSKLVGDVDAIAYDALRSLINVSADVPASVEQMINSGIINSVMEVVIDDTQGCAPERRNLCLTLLANITSTEAGAESMLMQDNRGPEGVHLRCLARELVSSLHHTIREDSRSTVDQWQYVASILCNVTRLEAGRNLIGRPELKLIEDLLPQLQSPSVIRRRGITGCIRNICFESQLHHRLLVEVRVLPYILKGLTSSKAEYSFEEKIILNPIIWRTPEESNAGLISREVDPETRSNLLEALELLCREKNSLEILRKQGTFYVIRELACHETDNHILVVCHSVAASLTSKRLDSSKDIELKRKMTNDVVTEAYEEVTFLESNDGLETIALFGNEKKLEDSKK